LLLIKPSEHEDDTEYGIIFVMKSINVLSASVFIRKEYRFNLSQNIR